MVGWWGAAVRRAGRPQKFAQHTQPNKRNKEGIPIPVPVQHGDNFFFGAPLVGSLSFYFPFFFRKTS
eukprot:m.270261 g.270261  ORF g.270261 m.270261 type:complete len:67 (+) comp16075_c0_seq1:1054-1254(+)